MLIGYAIKPTTMNSATDAAGEKAIACKGLLNKALPVKQPGTIIVKMPQRKAAIKDAHMSTVCPFGCIVLVAF